MFRGLLYLIIGLFLVTFLRMVIGVLSKGVGELFEPTPSKSRTADAKAPAGGELKRDPVCGTYVLPDSSVHAVVNGSTLYFCSPECRDKYGKQT